MYKNIKKNKQKNYSIICFVEGRPGLQPRTSVIVQVTDDEGHTSPAIGNISHPRQTCQL